MAFERLVTTAQALGFDTISQRKRVFPLTDVPLSERHVCRVAAADPKLAAAIDGQASEFRSPTPGGFQAGKSARESSM